MNFEPCRFCSSCKYLLLAMSLLKYFKKKDTLPTHEQTGIGQRETEEANKRVSAVLETSIAGKKCKPEKHSEETRAKIEKYAALNGAAAARRHFRSELGDLLESTVRKYKNLYIHNRVGCTYETKWYQRNHNPAHEKAGETSNTGRNPSSRCPKVYSSSETGRCTHEWSAGSSSSWRYCLSQG